MFLPIYFYNIDGGPLGFTPQMELVGACFSTLRSETGVNHYGIVVTRCRYTWDGIDGDSLDVKKGSRSEFCLVG